MKIVQAVGWYHPDSLGGTEIYVSSLARQLRGCGHQVVVAAPDTTITVPRVYEHDGCEVFRYPIPAQSDTRGSAGRRRRSRRHALSSMAGRRSG